MTRDDEIIHLSSHDEGRFGVRSAKASPLRHEDITRVMEFCRDHQVEFLIARCPTSDPEAAREMEERGFFLMDTLLYFARDLQKTPVPRDASGHTVRPVRAGEELDVKAVAALSFHAYDSHYHADPRLAEEQCDEVYADWAYRACTDREAADEVLVAECDGAVAGFGSMKLNSETEGEGGLFGVLPAFRGRGIYRSILIGCLDWCAGKGLERMLISTQVTNLASQKAWVRLGFEPSHSFYTFHKWFTRW